MSMDRHSRDWFVLTQEGLVLACGCLLNAFASSYRGDTTALRKATVQVIDDPDLYANAFVQVSGTRKSRLMARNLLSLLRISEMPTTQFVAEAEALTVCSVPPNPDFAVRKYLHEMEYTQKRPSGSHLAIALRRFSLTFSSRDSERVYFPKFPNLLRPQRHTLIGLLSILIRLRGSLSNHSL